MTTKKLIDQLLQEGEKISFKENSYSNSSGVFGTVSSELHAWITKVEHMILQNYGLESPQMRLFAKLDIDQIEGNFSDVFYKQHNIIMGALKACKETSPKKNLNPDAKRNSKEKRDPKSIFIVHGHDEIAKIKTARFIEQIGLKPIILHEQVNSGKTIIEKIEVFSNVGFGIVLYTPCDVGGKTKDDLKLRARQNVVFEHGFLIGKIGRENICALIKGAVEIPNDISGVVYVNMDEADGWKISVIKELKSAGYIVDMNHL